MTLNLQINYGTLVHLMDVVFSDKAKAYEWLMRENKSFGYNSPYLHMLINKDGIYDVIKLLNRYRELV